MDRKKKQVLQAKGWKIGNIDEFLNFTEEEAAYIELKLSLAEDLRRRRQDKHLTQLELEQLINSSQSRVAKMEAGDPSVSLDLLVRTLLSLGLNNEELGRLISTNA